ncbi:MAG TPA: YitT family protein [Chloroflexota bacterium]|jgi:uncharacterized membrane-anchored protein YitT (DUF2179 family)|nr:YitT family protein [Chloroflexota bacterium]
MTSIRTLVRDYIVLILGTLLLSASYALFLVPARISAGGVSGLAVVLHFLFHLPTGLLVFILNVPLLVVGYLFLGGLRFTVRTLVSVVIFSATVDGLGAAIHPLTHDAFLATLYGGVISGVGIGLVFGRSASTGGTTIVARLVQNFTRLSAGLSQLLVDAVVVGITGLVFGPQVALYSLIVLFISGKAIDWTLEGLSGERVALVVSPQAERISARITRELGRGATLLEGRGGYTGEERPVVMCVLDRSQEPLLRALVQSEDAQAFMVVTTASTVLGEGFAPLADARGVRGARKPILDFLRRAA